MKYVDDTLLLVKDKDVNYIQKCLNSFHKNINLESTPSQMSIHKLPQLNTLAFKNCMDQSIISSC